MNYYEHHLGDYDGATAHLSWLEDCAYRRLICLYYRNEGPIPSDVKQACRLVRAASKQERGAVQQVLSEFFELQGDGWHHKRCDEEVTRFQQKSQKARESVSKRWANRDANDVPTQSERNTNVDTNVLPTNNEGNTPRARPQTPDSRHQTPSSDSKNPQFLLPSVGGSSLAPPGAAPPTPPPAFDGLNAGDLNGKAIVPLSENFELPEDWGNAAMALGFKESETLREAERFRQYWTQGNGKGKRRNVKGWRQSWSNWLGKAARDVR